MVKLESSLEDDSGSLKCSKVKNNVKRKSKTKIEEYLECVVRKAAMSAKEDLELGRKLAKKLKVKGWKATGFRVMESCSYSGWSLCLGRNLFISALKLCVLFFMHFNESKFHRFGDVKPAV